MAETIRVLYVDDEPDLLEIGRIFLEHTGDFSVETIDSATAALDLMKSEYFDTIISDYQMPGLDGIEFLKKVRNSGNTIPFILFTGKGREEVVIQAINEGADFYLQKGGDPASQFAELTHKVRLAVSGKNAAGALKKSEDKYQQLIEHANEAIVVAQDGMLKLVNQRAIEVTGYPKQELLSMPFTEIIHPEDRAMVVERYQRRLKGEELPSRYEFRLSSKEGNTCWVELSAVVIDWDGRPATLNFISDVTGRKQADELLRISEEKYRKAFFTSPDSICITRLHDGMFVSVNKGFTEMTGYTEEDVAGKTSLEINIWKDPEDRRKIVEGLKAHGEVRDYEARFLTKTGEIYGVMSTSVIELNGVPHILNITRDLTGRKKAEEALQTGVERYKTISEMTTDFVFSCIRPDGDTYSIDWMTGAVERITGYTIDELVALGCWRCLVLPEDALVFDENITNLPAGTSGTCILRIQTKLGDTRWLEVHTSNNASYPNRIFGSCRDISERKQMEDARLTNEDRLQMTQEIGHIGCWEYDMKTNLMWGSGEGRHIFGFPPVSGSSPIEEYTSCITERELVLKAFNDLISEGKEYDLVFTINPKDGSAQRTLHSIGRLEKDEQGNPVKVRGINQDVTERKRAEEALRESVKKYSTIYDQSPIAIELYDASGILVNVNPACLELFGIENIQVIQNFSLFGDPNINDEQKKRLHQGETVQYQGPFDFEKVKAQKLYLTSREGVIWLDVLITPLENRADSITGFLVQIQDITERKRAELALAESEEVFREVFNNANDAIFLHELLPDGLPGQYFRVNDIACKRLGYSREELYKMSPRDIVSPQHSLNIPDIAAKLKSKGYATFEAIHQRKDGSTFPVEITTHIFTLQGRLVGLSIVRDTTERKKIEEALRESEEKYRLLIKNSHDIIYTINLEGVFTFVSEGWTELLGQPVTDMMGKQFQQFIHPDDIAKCQAFMQRVLETGQRQTGVEYRVKHANGSWRWHTTNAVPLRDRAGIIVGGEGNARDITEQKQAEEALTDSEVFNRGLVENLPDYVLVYGPEGKVLYVNPATEKAFGYSVEELIGTSLLSYIAEEHREEVTLRMKARHEGREVPVSEIDIVARDGHR